MGICYELTGPIWTEKPNQTRFDPPLADLRCCYPTREGIQA